MPISRPRLSVARTPAAPSRARRWAVATVFFASALAVPVSALAQPVLVSIDVTPVSPSVPQGVNLQLTAVGTFSDLSTQDLTAAATWSSSVPAVADVSNDPGSQGLATGLSPGMTEITATADGVFGTTALTVTAVDNDGDGYDTTVDCDDNDSSIHPGAVDVPGNDIDENCDGHAVCYADDDRDGYGAFVLRDSLDLDCAPNVIPQPGGGIVVEAIARINDDCDDTNPTINPGVMEVCDPANVDEDCDGQADDADVGGALGKTLQYQDADGDGYGTGSPMLLCHGASVASDCNDADASVHPGAAEIVGDGIDEDCDGHELCFTDADDDGARLATTVMSADADCDDPFEGKASDPIDCDDTNSAVHPGATEVCDPLNVDEDCNGLADDADPSATGKTLFYTDADGDGFGTGPGTMRCDPSAGTAPVAGDCDDGNPNTHPGAVEVCSDAVDNDCNGTADCLDASCAADPACGPSLCSGGPFDCKSAGVTQFDLRNTSPDDRDKVAFRWARGDPTSANEFGDPTVDTRYALCVWDDVAGVPTLVMEAIAPPAGNCLGRSCWRAIGGGDGFRYRDRGRLPNGLEQMTLRAGPLGKPRVTVMGRGGALPDPPTPFKQEPHITVQVVNSLGNCWGANYVSPARTNTTTHLSVKERP